jgi:hypothetical protein
VNFGFCLLVPMGPGEGWWGKRERERIPSTGYHCGLNLSPESCFVRNLVSTAGVLEAGPLGDD